MESGARLVTAHSLARAGGLLQVPHCEKQWSSTARHGRLSSATGRHISLTSGTARHRRLSSAAWWSDIDGVIDSAVFVVMQAHR